MHQVWWQDAWVEHDGDLDTSINNWYEAQRTIKAGTSGDTKLVQNKQTKEFFVLKQIPFKPNKVNLFDEEVENMSILTSVPSVAKFHSAYKNTEKGIIIMEYIEGDNLKVLYKTALVFPVYPIENMVKMMKQLSHGMKQLHDLDIAHLDVKPHNLMYDTKNNQYRFIDFGLSSNGRKSMRFTSGTATYAPLEVFDFMPSSDTDCGDISIINKAHDVWSLGMLFYKFTNRKEIDDIAEDHLQRATNAWEMAKFLRNYSDDEIESHYNADPKDRGPKDTVTDQGETVCDKINQIISAMLTIDMALRPNIDEVVVLIDEL